HRARSTGARCWTPNRTTPSWRSTSSASASPTSRAITSTRWPGRPTRSSNCCAEPARHRHSWTPTTWAPRWPPSSWRATSPGGARIAHRLIHYMDARERLTDRWHGAFRDWPKPLSLAWGLRDPVATVDVLSGLRALRSGVPVAELPDLGHYPQIEDPSRIAAA